VRKTFNGIESLATSINNFGLIHPLTVARLSLEATQEYLEVINHLWERGYTVRDLLPIEVGKKKEIYYYILIAGERRLRAIQSLDREKVGVNLCRSIAPLTALMIQFSENIHSPPPPHEEAEGYVNLYKLITGVNPSYSVAEFARDVAERSPGTIRNALRFCELPKKLRGFVEKGVVPYGIGVEISRLYQVESLSDPGGEIMVWAGNAIANGWTVLECREKVLEFIRNLEGGQGELFAPPTEEEVLRARRDVIGKEYLGLLGQQSNYQRMVLRAFSEGLLQGPEAPYSGRSPRRQALRLIELFE
jgi:hypothetical protein